MPFFKPIYLIIRAIWIFLSGLAYFLDGSAKNGFEYSILKYSILVGITSWIIVLTQQSKKTSNIQNIILFLDGIGFILIAIGFKYMGPLIILYIIFPLFIFGHLYLLIFNKKKNNIC
jgi:hypothetical protein